MMNICWKKKNNTGRGEKSNPENKSREVKVESRMAKRRRRWEDTKSNNNIQQIWGRRTNTVTMERDINKVTIQRRWIKRKNLGKPEGIFITNIVSKAYEIVKKIQNETVQSNMSNIYCRLQKRKTDQQWITSL